ncbi:hypothetical protein HX37_17555 [Salmonella enterica]|uniref:DUF3950 domain-containing protein n=1 Tax=Salmonella enterica TaxID=28901 RepID=A0A5U2F7A3_SALER|nr:hypothetical protein [Salmonella enterica]
MAKGHINSKTVYKGIRFPHELVNGIDQSVDREKSNDPSISFSSWVLDACEVKLKVQQKKQSKDNPDQ